MAENIPFQLYCGYGNCGGELEEAGDGWYFCKECGAGHAPSEKPKCADADIGQVGFFCAHSMGCN